MATESAGTRMRVAEALRSAGMSEQTVAAEVLLMLPGEFLDQYEALYLSAWAAPGVAGSVRVGDPNAEVPVALRTRVSTSQTETRGTASPKGRGSVSKGLGVRDLRAQKTKEWADRKLRKIAREIRDRLEDETATIRRCTGKKCRRLAEDTWNWCPTCGAPTEEVENI